MQPNARNAKNAEYPGSYEQVFKVLTPIISPGDDIIIEQYFTGYGEIGDSKLFFMPSQNLFNFENSYVMHSIKDEMGAIQFGKNKTNVTNDGFTSMIKGVQKNDWPYSTIFFDVAGDNSMTLLAEQKICEPPFKYHLRTEKKIKPGTYYMEFHFSYFNGSLWKSSNRKIEFKVQNFFERYNTLIGSLALAATIAALLRLAIFPVFKWICDNSSYVSHFFGLR